MKRQQKREDGHYMRMRLLENRQAKGWTVFGGYWPKGMVREETFRLADAAGNPVPMQSEVSARWPDGSIKWSRHTARAESLAGNGIGLFAVLYDGSSVILSLSVIIKCGLTCYAYGSSVYINISV